MRGSELSADKKWEKDGSLMNLIPAGSFEMGSDDRVDEKPVHTVELDAFYMDIYEVIVGQFKQFVNQSGYSYNRWDSVAKYSPTDDYPMIYVDWNDAVAYAKWAGKRLPTEAEWEYAARGGLTGKHYPWGNDITYDDANWGNTVSGKDKWKYCAPVGSFRPNGYGLYDMAGNLWEWCADWYASDYYANPPLRNPQGPSSGNTRVMRGGSWNRTPSLLRAAGRCDRSCGCQLREYGFRCVSGL